MKKLLALLMALLPFMAATAQITHDPQGATDRTAESILRRAAERFDQNVRFDVEASLYDSQQKRTHSQKASVCYHRGKYRLSVDDQEVICDGSTVWQWNKTAREVSIHPVGTDDIDLFNPARLLSNYANAFRAKYIRTETDGTAVVDLQPRSPRAFHKIRLLIDEKSGLLRRMEVHRYDSSREVYEVSHFQKATTPASSFAFDASKHSDVEIIDMR